MSLLNKRVSLLVTVVFLSTAVHANNIGFRPAAKANVGESAVKVGEVTRTANAKLVENARKEIAANPVLSRLPETYVDGLTGAFGTNKTIVKAVQDALFKTNTVKNDEKMNEIILLRLKILSEVNNVDFDNLNPAMLSSDNGKAQYLIARLAYTIEPTALSNEGKDRAIQMLTGLFEQLEILDSTQCVKALDDALEAFNFGTGLGLTIEDLSNAAQKEGGLNNLFKGLNDAQSMEIGLFEEGKVTVTVSAKQAEEIVIKAQNEFSQLLSLALNPQQKGVNESTGKIVSARSQDAADMFLNNNKLLERSEAALKISTSKSAKSLTSYDDLLGALKEYGSVIDGNKGAGKGARLFQKGADLPLVGGLMGRVADKLTDVDNAALKKKSLKDKINLARQALRDGIAQIHNDNQELNSMRAKAIEYALDLEKEMARLKLISDMIKQYIAENEATNPAMVAALKIHIGQRVERELNSVVATVRILKNSTTQIDTTIMAGMSIINQSDVLEREIIPIMAITEATHSAIAAQEAQMKRAEATRDLLTERLIKLAEAQERSLEQAARLAGTSVIDPKKLEEIENRMEKARLKFSKDMQVAYDKLAVVNGQLIKGHNKASHGDLDAGMAQGVENIINRK